MAFSSKGCAQLQKIALLYHIIAISIPAQDPPLDGPEKSRGVAAGRPPGTTAWHSIEKMFQVRPFNKAGILIDQIHFLWIVQPVRIEPSDGLGLRSVAHFVFEASTVV